MDIDKSFMQLSIILKDYMERSDVRLFINNVRYSPSDTARCSSLYKWTFPVYVVELSNLNIDITMELTLPVFQDYHDDVTVWLYGNKTNFKDSIITKDRYIEIIQNKIDYNNERLSMLVETLNDIKKI